jgi:hypothetical protein
MTNENPFGSTTSVMDAPANDDVIPFSSTWVRLGARLLAASLDAKLAAGEHPATNHLLAARAQRLASTQYRRGLANSWLNLLVEARRQRVLFDPAVPLVRSRVVAAEAQIHSLADALRGPLPTVRGLAMAIGMLRDGAGPLFNPASSVTLTTSINEMLERLNPLHPAANV